MNEFFFGIFTSFCASYLYETVKKSRLKKWVKYMKKPIVAGYEKEQITKELKGFYESMLGDMKEEINKLCDNPNMPLSRLEIAAILLKKFFEILIGTIKMLKYLFTEKKE
ncbi:MAG: hypothetical protein ACRCU2_31145 [Planktothrix sp.]